MPGGTVSYALLCRPFEFLIPTIPFKQIQRGPCEYLDRLQRSSSSEALHLSVIMRLTIIAPDSVYEHEVDPSMEVQDLQALIEAEVSQRSASFKAGLL